MSTHPWKTAPREYQLELLRATWATRAFWLQWEPGVGKSKPLIDQAAMLYLRKEIKQLLVVAPKGVHVNWVVDQLPAHMPDATNYYAVALRASAWGTKWHQQELERLLKHPGLRVLCVNYDALRLAKVLDTPTKGKWSGYLLRFVKNAPTMGVLDESRKIKNPDAERSKRAHAISDMLPWKRCADGTPAPKGPEDVYSQVLWLDSDFWRRHGIGSFTAFKRRYIKYKESGIPLVVGHGDKKRKIMEKVVDDAGNPVMVQAKNDDGHLLFNLDGSPKMVQKERPKRLELEDGYQNLDDLHEKLRAITSRLRKEDVLKELPPKIYQYRPFEMSPKQRAAYEELRKTFMLEVDGELVTASMALVRLLRLSQITSNYLPVGHEGLGTKRMAVIDEGENPRLESCLDWCDEVPGQAIIWCRFVEDSRLITEGLTREKFTWSRFDGSVSDRDRERSVAEFKAGDTQFMVARPTSGLGQGFTLTNAHYVYNYNRDPNLDANIQSEDRVHRLGQTVPPTIVDSYALGTVDIKLINDLRSGWDVQSLITDGKLREWLGAV